MLKHNKTHTLRLNAETVRTLTPGALSQAIGGMLPTHSYCPSEKDSCSGCNTAACSNVCGTSGED